jgi:hypothetical protein
MPEQVVKVFTRQISNGPISMWATLYLNTEGGKIAGWLCDAWTAAGTSGAERLPPRLHWLSREDNRFYRVALDIPVVGRSAMKLGAIDTEIEKRRETFIRATLALWENEYFTTQGVDVS